MNTLVRKSKFILLACGLFVTLLSKAQVINIANPSFEGPCNNCSWASVVPGWVNCAGGTADGLPGCWGVNGAAQNGSTYIGLLPGEALSQALPSPMLAGVAYKLTIWLSHSTSFSLTQVPGTNTGCSSVGAGGTQGAAGVMQIWGGNVSCGLSQLLYQSPSVTWTAWTQLTITLTPSVNYNFLTITELSTGNIIMDNMSPSITTLPIQLSSFKAVSGNTGVDLTWTTSSEKNNEKFVVERSTDGVVFGSIGEVAGAGNSSTDSHYSYTDTDPLAGCVYYRLKQVDFDGEYNFSQVVATTEELPVKGTVSVYPQPVGNSAAIGFSCNAETEVMMNIVDETGRIVASKATHASQGYQTQDINTSDLSKGIYFLTLSYNGQIHQQTKFLKE